MAKYVLLLCIVLFALSCVMACNPPGMPCSDNSQCCAPFVCNPWAGRCTKGGNWPIPPVGGGDADAGAGAGDNQ